MHDIETKCYARGTSTRDSGWRKVRAPGSKSHSSALHDEHAQARAPIGTCTERSPSKAQLVPWLSVFTPRCWVWAAYGSAHAALDLVVFVGGGGGGAPSFLQLPSIIPAILLSVDPRFFAITHNSSRCKHLVPVSHFCCPASVCGYSTSLSSGGACSGGSKLTVTSSEERRTRLRRNDARQPEQAPSWPNDISPTSSPLQAPALYFLFSGKPGL